MNDRTGIPIRIDVNRDAGEMEIEWRGGRVDSLALSALRRWCPCALCSDRREQQARGRGLHMLTPEERDATADVTNVVPVGRYAIQIRWGDGHDTGIYTYDSLRRMGEERTG
ncbi:MAG: DUF971 domain-containing protein [Gemmatimonadota bacterium]|nr:DUF971 domain-containing protein [Gemmatimonadota bacterium]